MDATKVILALCVFLLSVCLIFSCVALVFLRNALTETDRVRLEAQGLLQDMRQTAAMQNPSQSVGATDTSESDVPADVLYDRFCMKDCNGQLAIYTSDGYLVKTLDISTDSLPQADREALRSGIFVSSWKELLALIEDYTS